MVRCTSFLNALFTKPPLGINFNKLGIVLLHVLCRTPVFICSSNSDLCRIEEVTSNFRNYFENRHLNNLFGANPSHISDEYRYHCDIDTFPLATMKSNLE